MPITIDRFPCGKNPATPSVVHGIKHKPESLDMNYDDGRDQSAEYLRMAVQQMTRQPTAFHPVSYAVWYEYVSARNAGLRVEVDALLKENKPLDEQATTRIFQKHIAEIDDTTAQRVGQGLQKVMSDISRSASQAGNEAAKFGSALESWSETRGEDGKGMEAGVDSLLEHTRHMKGAISSLSDQLSDSYREIEQLREDVRKAREEAMCDGLTGLANRKAFDKALANCIAAPLAENGLSVLIADIDFFKRVNDTYGHLFGDRVIRAVADILKQNVKGKDTAARFGGEEFVVLLPDTPSAGAHKLAEQIRRTVERLKIKRADKNETVENITISLGVACYRVGESIADLLARADQALYASKHGGRNRVTLAAA